MFKLTRSGWQSEAIQPVVALPDLQKEYKFSVSFSLGASKDGSLVAVQRRNAGAAPTCARLVVSMGETMVRVQTA